MVTAAEIPRWLAELYPFTPHIFTTADGAGMSYLDEGPRGDEAVLMLHGNPTWSFYYRNLVRHLAPTLRCVVPDHVGMGLSEKPSDYSYTLATRVSDISALVASLKLKRVHLVVHDWGGAIGFGFAAKHPELIGRITILNTAAFTSREIPFSISLCKAVGFGPFIVRALNAFAGPATTMAMSRRRLSADEKRGYLFPYNSWAHRVAVSAFVQDIPLNDTHQTWRTLVEIEKALPQFSPHDILVVWGGRDFCFNDHFLNRWKIIFPGASVHRIADAGHYVLEDAGAEATNLISRFLLGN